MLRSHVTRAAFAMAIAVPLALAGVSAAQAAKKLSYEQAWAKCKAQIDKTQFGEQQTNRATAGAGCMRQYGYRLKK